MRFLSEFYRNVSCLDRSYVVGELERVQRKGCSESELTEQIARTLEQIASLGPLDV